MIQPFAIQDAATTLVESHFEIWGFGFANPEVLWGLLGVPLAMWFSRMRYRSVPMRLSRTPADLPRSTRQRLMWMPTALEALALVCAIIALARPLHGQSKVTRESEGIHVALLLDRSSSMEVKDSAGGKRRFDVAREVVGNFAERRMTDEEGASDHVALIGFANYVEVLCPFTLDATAMQASLEDLDIEKRRNLDGTAIGASVADAVRLLQPIESKSKIVVLLTDGKETTGVIEPMKAAQMAAEESIRVYTIFAGAKFEKRFNHLSQQRSEVAIDPGPLPDMAKLTGARFFHAEDETELEAAYAEIERLERTPRKEESYAEFSDRYTRWILASMVAFVLGLLSRATWARRLP